MAERRDPHTISPTDATPASEQPLGPAAREAYGRLQVILAELESVLIAYSGGVDSALLLKVATDVLGKRAIGALAASPAYDDEETREAVQTAENIGSQLIQIETNELEDPRYTANSAERCYFCKTELFDKLEPLARKLGLAHIAYGMNRDDRGDWRPGQRAAHERGVRAPLDEAGLGKAEIRELAHYLGLPVWNKPALACYSSRIPYGTPVTVEALAQIGRAERGLRGLGFRQVRVRHQPPTARIEIEPGEFARLIDPEVCRQVVALVRAAGYRYVTLDLEGYRTGSSNEALLRHATRTAGLTRPEF
jgi:pyridinium-3,5-biscarboxylic acid mononucleotide sulfurtransferase